MTEQESAADPKLSAKQFKYLSKTPGDPKMMAYFDEMEAKDREAQANGTYVAPYRAWND